MKEMYEIEEREVVSKHLFLVRQPPTIIFFIHLSLHNSFVRLIQLKSSQRDCLLLAYSMRLCPIWLANHYLRQSAVVWWGLVQKRPQNCPMGEVK